MLAIGIFGYFGIQTTSFVALIASGGVAVRPYCHNDHYWQVYFDTNRTIRESFGAAGFAASMPAQMVLMQGAVEGVRP